VDTTAIGAQCAPYRDNQKLPDTPGTTTPGDVGCAPRTNAVARIESVHSGRVDMANGILPSGKQR
jgi:hypothetical protein